MKAGCRIWLFFLFPAVLLVFPSGCRNTNQELLESELRTKEILFREALDELKNSEFRNQAMLREIDALRQHGATRPTPEEAVHTFSVRRIVLGRMTGGLDQDGRLGDDALNVVVEPRDVDDQAVRAPGNLQIIALEISPQGVKTIIGTWDISPEQLRRSWKTGLLSSGYVIVLPWKSLPTSDQVRVVARLVLPDGRIFEADRDIRIRLSPVPPHRPELPGPRIPEPELPPPRPLGPSSPESSESQRIPLPSPTADWQPAPLFNAIKVRPPQPLD
jgi:hypothetical protein